MKIGKPFGGALMASVLAATILCLPANALTINFDLNGVAPVVHSESDPDSNKVTVPNLDLDFDNMTFTGWNTKANGRGETVEPGQTTKEDVLTNNDTITLYAQWADGTHLDIPGEYASLDDLTNVIASIAGTAIEGFNPLNNGGVWTIPHGSVVTLDVTKLLPENWSATYTQPDANTIVFTLTGLDKYGKELVVTYTFIVEPEVSGVASSTNPNAPSAGIGGELSNMSGSNNNSSTNQTTFTNTATTNSNPLANIHLAAPIAFILAGILASLAVLQLTKREVARANQAKARTKTSTKTKANSNTKRSTTSHKAHSKSLPNLLTSYAKTIIHNKAYLSIAIISAIAILGGSLYLTKSGVIEAASEGEANTSKYQVMKSDGSIVDVDYKNVNGEKYDGYVTVVADSGNEVDNMTTWWQGGAKMSGEANRHGVWRYFDSEDDGHMVRDRDVYLPTDDLPDRWVRYDETGAMVYGEDEKDGNWYHFDEKTGAMTKGWYTLAPNSDVNFERLVCYDPQTGIMIKGETRVDPMMTDPSQYGALYDFDAANGNATWHLPVVEDLTSGRYPDSPTGNYQGDRRQRVLYAALSRLGAPYVLNEIPNGFVCDGLTAWAYTQGTGEVTPGYDIMGSADFQWDIIKNRNGTKTTDFQAGDLVFWGEDDTLTKYPGALGDSGWPGYHAGIYYHDDQMIHSGTTTGSGVHIYSVSNYPLYHFLGGGSPYSVETSRAPIRK